MDYFKILPPDITLEILTRLPTQSVLDCKIVCTNWRNIISHHPSFSKMQLHHVNHTAAESGKLGFLALTNRRKLHYFEYDEGHDQSTKPIQRITRVSFTPSFEHFRVRIVGSYNGLICLSDYSHQSVCICNPITREYLMLAEIKRDCDTDGYSYEENSFGYVSSTNEYKVVGFYKFKTYLEVHIYTLGSGNGWRNIGKFNFGYRVCLKYQVFFANGALYWLDEKLEVIGMFDLAEEKFCEHLSPPPLPPYCDWFCRRIGVLDGFLYFSLEDEVDGFHYIWLLKNHHKEEGEKHRGWSEELRIDNLTLHSNPEEGEKHQ